MTTLRLEDREVIEGHAEMRLGSVDAGVGVGEALTTLHPFSTDGIHSAMIGVAQRHNPFCGDRIEVGVRLRSHQGGGGVSAVRWAAQGCALSSASASLMTQACSGLGVGEVLGVIDAVGRAAAPGGSADSDVAGSDVELLGEAVVLRRVSRLPGRHRCVMLTWTALAKALAQALADALVAAPSRSLRPRPSGR